MKNITQVIISGDNNIKIIAIEQDAQQADTRASSRSPKTRTATGYLNRL